MLSHGVLYPVILSAHFKKEEIIMKINTVELAMVATLITNSETGDVYPLFGFAIEALIDKVVKYINNGCAVGVLIEKEDLEKFDYEKQTEFIHVIKTRKKNIVVIGIEEGVEVDDTTLDKIKDAVCDADFTELQNVYEDRIVAINPNEFFSLD
jgi:hypothetical protein